MANVFPCIITLVIIGILFFWVLVRKEIKKKIEYLFIVLGGTIIGLGLFLVVGNIMLSTSTNHYDKVFVKEEPIRELVSIDTKEMYVKSKDNKYFIEILVDGNINTISISKDNIVISNEDISPQIKHYEYKPKADTNFFRKHIAVYENYKVEYHVSKSAIYYE